MPSPRTTSSQQFPTSRIYPVDLPTGFRWENASWHGWLRSPFHISHTLRQCSSHHQNVAATDEKIATGAQTSRCYYRIAVRCGSLSPTCLVVEKREASRGVDSLDESKIPHVWMSHSLMHRSCTPGKSPRKASTSCNSPLISKQTLLTLTYLSQSDTILTGNPENVRDDDSSLSISSCSLRW